MSKQNQDQQVSTEKDIVLFDGICNLCNRFIRFIAKRDKLSRFRFVVVQSAEGKLILNQNNLSPPIEPEYVIFITKNKYYSKSDAVLHIFKRMTGLYQLFYCLIILPKIFRDPVYDLIARNRYKLFGKQDSCEFP